MVLQAFGEFLFDDKVDLRSVGVSAEVVREVFQTSVHAMLDAEWIRQVVVGTNVDIVPERVTRLLNWLVPAGTMADNLLIQFCVAAAMEEKILRRLVKVIFLHLQLSKTDYR